MMKIMMMMMPVTTTTMTMTTIMPAPITMIMIMIIMKVKMMMMIDYFVATVIYHYNWLTDLLISSSFHLKILIVSIESTLLLPCDP